MREAAKRSVGMRPFDVQIMGAIVLHEGDIAEMKTGEGKTLVATMPLYLNALPGRRRPPGDGERLPGQARRRVDGARLRSARHARRRSFATMMPFAERKEAYAADITYGTNSEFGFDYLRDNMATSLEGNRPARAMPTRSSTRSTRSSSTRRARR